MGDSFAAPEMVKGQDGRVSEVPLWVIAIQVHEFPRWRQMSPPGPIFTVDLLKHLPGASNDHCNILGRVRDPFCGHHDAVSSSHPLVIDMELKLTLGSSSMWALNAPPQLGITLHAAICRGVAPQLHMGPCLGRVRGTPCDGIAVAGWTPAQPAWAERKSWLMRGWAGDLMKLC